MSQGVILSGCPDDLCATRFTTRPQSTSFVELCILSAMKRLLTIILLTSICSAQHLVKKGVFDAIAGEYSGERAQENIRAIVEYSRIQGSPMMASVASDVVLAKLKASGIESNVEQW